MCVAGWEWGGELLRLGGGLNSWHDYAWDWHDRWQLGWVHHRHTLTGLCGEVEASG